MNTPQTQSILSAAKDCYLRYGLENTGMREVSEAAGIARSTLYRYFPNRDDLLVAVIKVEMEAMNESMAKKLKKHTDPADHIVEGLIMAINALPKNPLLNAVFAADDNSATRKTVWQSQTIVELGEQLLATVIEPALNAGRLQDQLPPEMLIEWVYRVLISMLTLPSNFAKTNQQLRTMLHGLLIPVLLK